MKVSKPFKLFVPTSIKNGLVKYLANNPPGFKYDAFDFYFIINYLLYKQIFAKKNEDFFKINRNHLKTVIGSKSVNYIKYLRNGEFIISDGIYKIGEKPFHYKLNPKFDLDLNSIPIKPGTKLFEKMNIKIKNKRAHFNRLEPHLKEMKDKLMNLQFDYESAKNFVSKNPDVKKRLAYLIQIESLEDVRLRYFKRNKTNDRLDTNITNLKSELRQFIISDSVHVDLKNSQPFFLNQLLNRLNLILYKIYDCNRINNNSTLLCCSFLKFDLVKTFGIKVIKSISKIHQKQQKVNLVNLYEFAECVNAGTLYDYVGNYFNGKYKRNEIKKMMFEVLFSQNVVYKNSIRTIPYEKEKQVFAEVFPYIAEVVKILKSGNIYSGKYKKLPILLQKIESNIFIDFISKDLVNAGIVPITIHDSVIVEKKHKDKAIEIINNVFFQNFNVIPLFHVE